ncbi:unnamed protein product, partial [Brassica oleracea var. botrytis]
VFVLRYSPIGIRSTDLCAIVLFVWLSQVSASAAAAASAAASSASAAASSAAASSAASSASMRTVVVRFADADAAAAAYYIATADFIGVSRRTRRSDAASDAVSCVNETNKS